MPSPAKLIGRLLVRGRDAESGTVVSARHPLPRSAGPLVPMSAHPDSTHDEPRRPRLEHA